jgi:type II secretory pathway pseudopilin PulG
MGVTANRIWTGELMRRPTRLAAPSRGFTYVGLIVLVAIIGLVAASTLKMGALLQRRAVEQDLLDIGAAFTEALNSYADSSGPEQARSPTSLEQLLRDPRFPFPKRHLRQLYADPVTGVAAWGIVRGIDQRSIIAVYSLSNAKPIKLGNFAPGSEQFENKAHLSDWKFTASGGRVIPAAPLPSKPASPAVPATIPAVTPTVAPNVTPATTPAVTTSGN